MEILLKSQNKPSRLFSKPQELLMLSRWFRQKSVKYQWYGNELILNDYRFPKLYIRYSEGYYSVSSVYPVKISYEIFATSSIEFVLKLHWHSLISFLNLTHLDIDLESDFVVEFYKKRNYVVYSHIGNKHR